MIIHKNIVDIKYKCEVGTTIVVNHAVQNVDGVYIEGLFFEDSPVVYGYKFIEGEGWGGAKRALLNNDPRYSRFDDNFRSRQAKYILKIKALPQSFWFHSVRYSVRSLADENDELGHFD